MDKTKYAPTTLEKVASSLPVGAGAALLAGAQPLMLGPLLPVLAYSLAAGRQAARVEAFISDVCEELNKQEEAIKHLSDTQYHVINQAVLAGLHTLDEQKLDYLRYAIKNTIKVRIPPSQSAFVARIIRDISAGEAAFLVRYARFETLALHKEKIQSGKHIINFHPEGDDAVTIAGLMGLGLFRNGNDHSGGVLFHPTPVADIVKDVLMPPKAHHSSL